MLIKVRCSCGHTGIISSLQLPRLLCCSAFKATRLFKPSQGAPIKAPVKKFETDDDEEKRWELYERSGASA
jgi:hypothetical protein